MEYKITTRKRKIYVIGKLKIIILQDILFTDILIYLTKWNMFSYVEFYVWRMNRTQWEEFQPFASHYSIMGISFGKIAQSTVFSLPNIITYLIKIAHLHCLLMSSIPNRLENICMNRICSASGDILGSILGNCCSGWPARRSLLQIG